MFGHRESEANGKSSTLAVAHCKAGKGLIKVNGKPLELVQPEILRFKVYEPVLILGVDKFGASTSPAPITPLPPPGGKIWKTEKRETEDMY